MADALALVVGVVCDGFVVIGDGDACEGLGRVTYFVLGEVLEGGRVRV